MSTQNQEEAQPEKKDAPSKTDLACDFFTEQLDADIFQDITSTDSHPKFEMNTPLREESYSFGADEIVELANECGSFELTGEPKRIRTPRRKILVVQPASLKAEALTHFFERGFSQTFPEGLTISFRPKSFIVAYVAYKLDAYIPDHVMPDSHASIELLYDNGAKRLKPEVEDGLMESFMFEAAATLNLIFNPIELQPMEENPFDEFSSEEPLELRPLEPYNEGISLFNAAVRVENAELRLLSLYKVLEYFAPVVFSMEGNDALRKKFDSPEALRPDGGFLTSIFDLVRSQDKRKTDKEMIKALFLTCLDMVELSKLLPKPLNRQIDYDTKRNDADAHSRQVAEILVATRNQVAHAKSNYELQGNELPSADIPAFNIFLERAASQTIRWYNRLPIHLRLPEGKSS